MDSPALVFSVTGTIQSYVVPTAGTYFIEALGAQGGPGPGAGGRGARVSGMFYLNRGDVLKIVAGRRGLPAGSSHGYGSRGGASMIWTGPTVQPEPVKLMLCARGGAGGAIAVRNLTMAPGIVVSHWDHTARATEASSFDADGAALDPATARVLATQWTRSASPQIPERGTGTVRFDRGGYNAGSFRTSAADVNEGDGFVAITLVAVPTSAAESSAEPPSRATPPTKESRETVRNESLDRKAPPAPQDHREGEPATQPLPPPTTPGPGSSWADRLRKLRGSGTDWS
jgi:hypothetical protein